MGTGVLALLVLMCADAASAVHNSGAAEKMFKAKSNSLRDERAFKALEEAGRVAVREKAAKAGRLAEVLVEHQLAAEKAAKAAALKTMRPVLDANEAKARGLLHVFVREAKMASNGGVWQGPRHRVEIGGVDTVEHLKDVIAAHRDFGYVAAPAQELRLHPTGPELDDSRTLTELGIDFGTEIYLRVNRDRLRRAIAATPRRCDCNPNHGNATFTSCEHREHTISPTMGRFRNDGIVHLINHVSHNKFQAESAGVKGFVCTRAGFRKNAKHASRSAPLTVPVCKCCECV